MRVGFPRIGSFHVFLKPALRQVGIDLVESPGTSRSTLNLGIKHNPEMICAPCKLLFGNYVEALQEGVEGLIILGGAGTCRLGYSARIQAELLRTMGFKFTPYLVNLYNLPGDALRLLRVIANPSLSQLIETARFLLVLMETVDRVEQEALRIRPLEMEKGAVEKARDKIMDSIASQADRAMLNENLKTLLSDFDNVPREDRRTVRVALIGDLYTMMEPFFNMNLESELGKMGVHVERSYWPGAAVTNGLRERILRRGRNIEKIRAAGPYMARDIGGFAQSTVGEAVLFAQSGIGGLIHLAPFNCSPEIMAQNALLSLRRKLDVPILSLSFDEQTGKAGLLTRLEAFVDILERRDRLTVPLPAEQGWRQHVAVTAELFQDVKNRLNESLGSWVRELMMQEKPQESAEDLDSNQL